MMNADELNKAVKDLREKTKGKEYEYTDAFKKEIDKEFSRLYCEDKKFERMNKESVLIMFRMNLRYRFFAPHRFGLEIEW